MLSIKLHADKTHKRQNKLSHNEVYQLMGKDVNWIYIHGKGMKISSFSSMIKVVSQI